MNENFIVFSGIDSSGKSTQIENIKNDYNYKKIKIIWSRGGYTSWLQILKTLIRKVKQTALPEPGQNKKRDQVFQNSMVQKLWLILAILDLIRLYSFSLRLYQLLGYKVICDRYLWDTYIDFKIKFPYIDFERWYLWKFLVWSSATPKVSIILVISPEESLRRSQEKKEPFSEDINIRKKRLGLYNKLIDEGKWQYVINAERPIMEVWSEIKEVLSK